MSGSPPNSKIMDLKHLPTYIVYILPATLIYFTVNNWLS